MKTLIIVPCGQTKSGAASDFAYRLYRGDLFNAAIPAAITLVRYDNNAEIRILSARYGLIELRQWIDTYDLTIKEMSMPVMTKVVRELTRYSRVIGLLSVDYDAIVQPMCKKLEIPYVNPLHASHWGIFSHRRILGKIARTGALS